MHARQRPITAALVALLVTAMTLAAAPAAHAVDYADPAGEIVKLTNSHRASHDGLGALKRSSAMDSVAQAWAEKLASDYAAAKSKNSSAYAGDYLRHNPNFADQIPTGWTAAGENVAWNKGYPDPAATLVSQWIKSSGHHDNLASTKYTHIGVGFYTDKYGVSWGVQVFAKYSSDPGGTTSSSGQLFPDIPKSHTYFDSITWLASTGITTGYSDGTFKPNEPVGRAAMAAFLYRFAGSPSFKVPARSEFPDVPTSYRFYKEIAWLASTGITTGYSDGEFKSSESVGRAAMAMFLYRAAGEPSFTPPKRSPFSDVSTDNRYYKAITWLASTGITVGYDDGTFRPSAPVGRAAMSMFLLRFDRALGAPEV